MRQVLIATLQPSQDASGTPISSQLFLTSPSGSYAAYVVRQETVKSLGHDYCYIQVQGSGDSGNSFTSSASASASASTSIDSNSHGSWQFGCAAITGSDACRLVFSGSGLGVFGGAGLIWGAGPRGGHATALALLDSGDLEMTDQGGAVVWKASEAQATGDNQSCGDHPSSGGFSGTGQNQGDSQQGNGYQHQYGANHPRQQGMDQPLSGFDKPFSNGLDQPFGASEQQGFGDNNVPFENGVSEISLKLGFILACLIANLNFLL
ncbi:hypothetical protein SAY87_021629 [Trapa incisa]|uniref:Uncharacterized protein n=1 Tax=Trapa incisa TaxID=236973 RepID=A0AAN7JSA5_9MYRT|nr:hypothetical protein SAY87_021629 [Trapa incisa]